MLKFKILINLLLILASYSLLAQSGTIRKVPIQTFNNNPDGYIEYLPPGYDDSGETKYPAIFWLHGLGENGNGSTGDLDKIYNKQIANWLKTNDVSFIVLIPQDHSGYFDHPNLENFVEFGKANYPIDNNQLHLAGLSAGGYGMRSWTKQNTDSFKQLSTLTPMSTNYSAGGMNDSIRNFIIENEQYMWFHHGETDGNPNKVGEVIKMHRYLYEIDPTVSRLTVYKGIGHSAWNEVYDNSGQDKAQLTGIIAGTSSDYYEWTPNDETWYEWLLSHPKKGTEKPPTDIVLSKSYIENNLEAGATLATLSALGTPSFTFTLASGSGDTDNGAFEISGKNLLIKNGSDKTVKDTYSLRIEVSSPHGTLQKTFALNVIDPDKTLLTVKADNKSIKYGQAIPNLTITYEGFLNSDNESSLDIAPSISTIANESSEVNTYAIEVSGAESISYDFAYINGTLTINKADLTASIDDYTITYGDALPEFSINYDGFVKSEGVGVLNTLPTILTEVVGDSDAGEYALLLTGGTDNNYNFIKTDGKITINKADQNISLLNEMSTQTATVEYVLISAEVDTDLELTYNLNSGPGTIVADTIFLTGEEGSISYSVKQTGNINYNSAELTGSFDVVLLSLDNLLPTGVKVYPNPTTAYLKIEIPNKYLNQQFSIYSMSGKILMTTQLKENQNLINVKYLRPGSYIFSLNEELKYQFIKR